MKYNLSENLSGRKGVVSNLHGFLNRHLDTGFKSKWSGYWAPPIKYFDYFSFKVNGIWLNKDTLQGVEYGEKMVFYHETGSLSIEEHIKAPEKTPGLEIELRLRNNDRERKAVQIVMELGADIRHKTQDISRADYSLDKNEKRLSITGKSKNLVLKSEKAFKLNGDSYMKDHHPGERQRCFVPGEIVFRKEVPPETRESLKIDLLTSDGSFKSIEKREQELRNQELGRTFNYSIESMLNLTYDRQGLGLIAGHPWFLEYWARDTFWTILGLIDAGYFELSKDILENFADKGLKSQVELEGGTSDGRERADTDPLFVIAVEKLRRHYKTSEKLEKAVEHALGRVETDKGIVQHGEDATWMDTLKRAPAVDIQSLWLEAAGREDKENAEDLAKGLEKFKEEAYMKDFLGEDSPETVNPAVPLMFGQLSKSEADKYLEKVNGEFSSMYGARTRAVTDLGYSGEGYHSGAVWGLTTGWAAAANLEYGRETEGRNFLEKMTQFIDRNQPGALPEVVNAETGALLGCSEQAWSAGLYIHVVDTYLLGIKVQEDKVVIDPASDFSGKRLGKRVGNEVLDIEFDDGEVKILNDPDLEVEIKS
ncbi:MAG: amylo-alpha-1,6-glucosidase [Candidatus Nanohalobium sp.]